MNNELVQMELRDVQADVPVIVTIDASSESIRISLRSAEGGECEAHLTKDDSRSLREAMEAAEKLTAHN